MGGDIGEIKLGSERELYKYKYINYYNSQLCELRIDYLIEEDG